MKNFTKHPNLLLVLGRSLAQAIFKLQSTCKFFAFCLLLIFSTQLASAQTTGDYRSTTSGNWNTRTNWERWNGAAWNTPTGGQGYPGQNTTPAVVTIQSGDVMTLNVTPANSLGSLIFNTSTVAASVTHTGTNSLTINGAVTINQPTANITTAWNINGGSATVGGLISFAGSSTTATQVGTIAITTGTLNANAGITFTASVAASKIIDMSGGAGTLNLKGTLTVPAASSTLTAGTTSTFNYVDNLAQTINIFSAGGYNNLGLSGSSVKSLSANTTLNGDVTIAFGTTLSGSTFTLDVAGDWTNNGGTFTAGTSTVNFNGSVAQVIGGTGTTTFNNLSSNNTNVTGLSLSNDITVNGNWTNNGTAFSAGTRTVTFAGTSVQTIGGTASTTFYNLTNTNTNATGFSLGTDITVSNNLTLSSASNGKINTGTYTLILTKNTPLSAISGSNSTRYIVGNLQFKIPAGATAGLVYPIGTSTIYAPVTLSITGAASNLNVKVSSTTGAPTNENNPITNSSGINQARKVGNYWTITNVGSGTLTGYDAIFDFTNTTNVGTVASYKLRNYSSSWANITPVNFPSGTTIRATGISTFGEFEVGEANTSPAVTANPANTATCIGSNATFTSTASSSPASTVTWQRNTGSGFADITTANQDGTATYSGFNTTTLTITAATASMNGYLYQEVFSNINGTATSASATLTINPLPTITTSATAAARCFSGSAQTSTLAYSATTNSPTNYTITWNAAAITAGLLNVGSTALPASPITVPIAAGVVAGTYTGTLTVTNVNGCASTGNSFTVTINALPTITTSATAAARCFSSSAQTSTLAYSATTNSPTNYTITWNAAAITAGLVSVGSTALPASPITVPIAAGVVAGTYTGTLTVTNGNGCASTGNSFTVTINALPTITTSATAANVCFSSSAQNSTLTYSATTNTPTNYTITWNAAAITAGLVNLGSTALPTTPVTIPIATNVPVGTYTGTLTVTNANGCASAGNSFTVTINALPTITTSATAAARCFSSSAQISTLAYSATTNSPTNYTITWNAAAITAGLVNVGSTVLPASPITVPIAAGVAAGTYTGTLTVTNGNGCASLGNSFTVTINALPTITTSATAAARCISSSAQTSTLAYSATTNAPTNYTITWNAAAITAGLMNVGSTALPVSPITVPIAAGVVAGTYTGTLSVTNGNGCASSGNSFTITINALPTITTSATAANICFSSSAQNSTLAYSANTNTPTNYTINWNAAAITAGLVNLGSTALPATPITIPIAANVPAGTYTGTLTVINANGCASTGNSFTVTINALPTITSSPTAVAVCFSSSAQNSTLAYSATTNSPTNYTITWNAAAITAGLVNVGSTALPASPIIVPIAAGVAAGTYTGTLTVINGNGCASTGNSFTVTINALPVVTISANYCLTAGQVRLTSNAFSSYIWNTGATTQYIDVLTAGTYAVTATNASGCSATTSYSVSTELVINGDFSAGNTGFITLYTNDQAANGLYPEATYAVNNNANFSHGYFFGTDHTSGSGNFMVVNGSSANQEIWEETVTVVPNTTYYFSAWAMSVNDVPPYGELRFAVNNVQVGSTAILTAGANSTAGPFNWVRFYGTWNSGSNTSAIINVIDLQTAPNGNDFGLDDISFSTLSPVLISAAPTTNSPVCTGNSLNLSSNVTGGNYPLTYTWSGPGSFSSSSQNPFISNVTGTNAGVYSVTVTDNNGCAASASTASVTINALPTITTPATAAAVCFSSSAQNSSLTYSATTNTPTNYTITWNAAATTAGLVNVGSTALPVSPITVPIAAGVVAGTYTGTLTVTNGNGCASLGNSFTVTINALPTITTSATAAARCFSSSAQTSTLAYSATTNTPTNYTITWNAAAITAGLVNVGSTALPVSPITVPIAAGVVAGTYTGTLTVTNGNGCASTGNSFTVTINALPTITTSATAAAVCFSSSAQNSSLTYSATTNTPTNYTITWNAAATTAGLVNVGSTALPVSPITVPIAAGVVAGTYTGTLTVTNGNGCASLGNSFTVTINALPTITTPATAAAVCFSSSAQNSSLTYSATTNTPTNYTITWNAAAITAGLVNVGSTALPASPITVPIAAGVAAGTYTGTLTVTNGNGCASLGNSFTVTINALPTITTSATAAAVCFSSSAQNSSLTYSATTNTPTNYTITWNAAATTAGLVNVGSTALPASPITVPIAAGVTAGTYTGTLTVTNGNGCASTGNSFTVTINALPTITTPATAAAVCFSSSAQTSTLAYSATTNTPTNYTITWNAAAITAGLVNVGSTALPVSPITVPIAAGVVAGTYTGTLTVTNGNGCASTGNSFTVTINALPTITTSATAAAVCFSSSAQNSSLTYSATTNTPTNYTITWNAAATTAGLVNVGSTALPVSPITVPIAAGVVAGTYTGTLTVTNGNGCASLGNSFTVTINALPTITTPATAAAVCFSSSAQNSSLTYSATTNTPTNYTITWNAAATTAGLVNVGSTALPVSPITVPIAAGVVAGTYTGTLTVTNGNGCASLGNSFTVTINALPTITTSATAAARCFSSSAQTSTLAYSATTNTPTNYTITWNAAAITAGLVNVGSTALPVSPITVPIAAGVVAGTYTGTLTVTNGNGCASLGNSFTVTINALPTITTSATAAARCFSSSAQTSTLAYSATTNTPTNYTITWNAAAITAGLVNVGSTALPVSPITVPIAAGVVAGTYTGTLTVTNGNGCASTGNSFTVTINALPTITTSATAAAVCFSSSAQNSSLTYSATTNTPTNYTITWNAAATTAGLVNVGSTALPVSPITVPIAAGVVAGTYTGTLTVTNGNGCASLGNSFTVTINALPTITTPATAAAVCFSSSAQNSSLTYSATTNTPTNYTITWNAAATTAGLVNVGSTALPASPITVPIAAGVTAGTYTGTLTVTNGNGCASTGNSFTVTINALPTITTPATAAAVCFSSSAQTSTLAYSATTNTPTNYTITWNAAAITAGLVNVGSTALPVSPITVPIAAGVVAGTYTGTLTVTNGNGCASTGNSFTVTINALPTITTSATAAAVCFSSSAQNSSLTYSATTNTPTNYTITWNAAATTAGLVNVGSTALPVSPITVPIAAGVVAGTYTGTLTVTNGNGCASTGNSFTVTINALPTITTSATAAAVCFSSSAQNSSLTYSATTNTPTNYTITWNAAATTAGLVNVGSTALPVSPITVPIAAGVVAGTYTGTLTVTNGNGCASLGNSFTVTINALPTITTSATAAARCFSSSAQTSTLAYSATTNTPTNYTITWNAAAITAGLVNVGSTALPVSPITVPIAAGVVAGTYTGTLTVTNGNGCASTGNSFTVTINALPTITTSATAAAVCFSSSAQNSSLTYSATTNTPTNYTITWNAAATTAGLVNVGSTALPVSPITVPIAAGVVAGTYTGTLTVTNGNGCASLGNSFTVTINALPTITTPATAAAVCFSSSAQNSSLTYSATTNTPTNYTITWNAAAITAGLVNVGSTALPASPITVPIAAGVAAGTYTGTLTVTNGNGCASLGNSFTVTINALPTITTPATAAAVCFSSSAQNSSLTYSATTNTPTNYTITWNAAATTAGLVNVGSTALPVSPITVPIAAGVVAGTYTGTLTVTNGNGCASLGNSFTVTINALPTITTPATAAAVCFSSSAQTSTLAYSATTNTPTNYTITWNAAAITAGLVNVGSTALPVSPITVPIAAGVVAGTYTGTLTVTNGNGCASTGNSFTVTINALPTITTSATAAAVCFSSSAQNSSLTYSATTNTPTNYTITWNAAATTAGLVNVGSTALPVSPITVPIAAGVVAGTYTGTLTVTNGNGCASTGNSFTVTINALPTITTSATAAAVCFSSSAQNSSLTYSATTNTPTNYTITWNAAAITAGLVNVGSTALPASPITVPIAAGVAAGTYTSTLTVTNGNGCASLGNSFTVTINALPTITTSATAAARCFSSSAQTSTLAYSATTNTPTNYTITWNAAAITAGLVNVGSTALPASPITVPIAAGVVAGTYTGTLTVTNGNGCASLGNSFTVTINALPTITTSATAAARCFSSSAQTSTLAYSATTNTPTNYTITWNAAAITAGLVNVGSTALPASPITVPIAAGIVAGTYTGTLTVTNGNGCASLGNSFTVTINALPTITTSATAATRCFSSSAQNSTLAYSATSNTPTNYTITWNAAAITAGLVNVGSTALPVSPITVPIAAGVTAGTYTGTLTVTNGNGCASLGNSFTVTINALPTITTSATPAGVCFSSSAQNSTLAYSATTNTPTNYTITWNAAAITAGLVNVGSTALPVSPITVQIAAGVAAGTYTGTLTVTNGNGCASTANSFTVTINGLPADISATASSSTICSGNSTNILITSSQIGVNYQLRNNTGNINIGSSVAGNGGLISLPTGALTSTTTFNIMATNATTGCNVQISTTVAVTVNPAGQWIGGASGDWNSSSNWCGGIPTSSTNVIIPASTVVYIQTANAVANSVTIASTGNLTMSGVYNLAITANGSFTNNGTFNGSASSGTISFLGNGTVSGTTVFQNIDTRGALDFGTSSTIAGTFSLQTGGTVTGHSPTYTCPSSLLLYKTGSVFTRGLEWTTNSSGTGYPSNVTIQNNTTINFPLAGQGYVCNDLTIDPGSALQQDYAGGSANLKVGRNIVISGTLSLGTSTGGDISLGGSWTRNAGGVFTHNDRMVTFDGPANFSGNGLSASTISAPSSSAKDNNGGFGGENFAHLWINKNNATDSVILLSNITIMREIGFTKGAFNLRNSDVTIVSNDTRTADVAPVVTPANVDVRYSGTGRFVIQRFIQNPTAVRSWRLVTVPLQSSLAPTVNEAFQEGVVNPVRTSPNANGGIYNPWPGYGTHITGPGGVYSAANGFDQGTNNPSILYASGNIYSWINPVSTKTTKVTDQAGWMLFVRGDRSFTIGNQYVPAQNTTLEPKGKINIGNVAEPVGTGFQVLSNPYASEITLSNVDFNGTFGKNSNYYLWDTKYFTSYTQPGKWVTFTGVGNTFLHTSSASTYAPNGLIESGQALVSDMAATGNVTFHESDKLPLSSSLIGIANRPAQTIIPVLRSDMYVKNAGSYFLTDGVLNIYDGSYKNDVTQEDAKKIISFNTKESFSIMRNFLKLAIEKRSEINASDTIFFAISKLNELPYQFKFTASDFDTTLNAFLEDKFTGSRTPISMSGTTIVDFTITSDSLSKVQDRFRIVFKPAFSNPLPVTFKTIKAWQKTNDIAVEWEIENETGIRQYELEKSANGTDFRKVFTTAAKGNSAGVKIYGWLDVNAAPGDNYYRIRSVAISGIGEYSKVVKVNITNGRANIAVYPNPVNDKIIGLQLNNLPAGNYGIRLLNSIGQVICIKKIKYNGGNETEKISTPFLAKGIYSLEVVKPDKTKTVINVISK